MSDGSDTGKDHNDSGTGEGATPTVNKYVAKLRCLVPIEQESRFAFRGHADPVWELESTARRRHDSETPWEELIEYNCNLVDEAKNANYHQKENKLEDIEMLAELRHHSAATALIDFTRDFHVALWFACTPIKCDSQEGKIFVVNTGDIWNFRQLTSKDKKKSLEAILRFQTHDRQNDAAGTDKGLTTKTPGLWYWEPRFEINHRLSSQKGVFIFGKDDIPCQAIKIPGEDKKAIREELSTWFGINEESLFNDLPGFATVNDVNHKIPPKTWKDYLRAGNSYHQQREWEKAIAQYDKTIERNSKCTAAYNNRGLAKAQRGRFEKAIPDFDQAIDLNDQDAAAYYNRGSAKLQLGRFEEAIPDFNQVIDLNDQDAMAYTSRGTAKLQLRRFEEAIPDFGQAIDLNPQDATAYTNRGTAKLQLRRFKEALQDFDQAFDLNPQDATAYNNRGIVKIELGHPKEALRDFDQAISLNDQDAMAYTNSGNAKRVLGRSKEALRDLTQAIKLNPQYATAYYGRAKAHATLGDTTAARADFNKALDLATKQDDKELAKLIQEDLKQLPPTT